MNAALLILRHIGEADEWAFLNILRAARGLWPISVATIS